MEELFTYLADLDNPFVVGVFVEKIKDGQLDEVVSSLAARLDDPARDATREWIKRVKAARKQRNAYLHSVYMPLEHEGRGRDLYMLGRRALDRQNGTAEPNLSKLLSDNLRTFHGEAVNIRQSFEELLDNHFPFVLR